MNTIIDNLKVGDTIYFEWEDQLIIALDQHICKLKNTKWDIYWYSWSEIKEELQLRDMEQRIESLVDNATADV